MASSSLTHFSLGQKEALMIFCTSSFINKYQLFLFIIDSSYYNWFHISNFYREQARMVVSKYSHAFTKVQLQLIIDDYLGMAPYYTILHHKIKDYINRIQQHSQTPHANDKPHPIRIYTKDYFSKNFQEGDTADLHIDMRTTYSSAVPKYYYIYPLQVIVEILQSQSFYQSLPKNIIINHLLTTENIQIIIETLTIISQEMSKKIKTTLASKDVRRTEVVYKEKQEQKKEDEDFFAVELPPIQEEGDYTVLQSRVDIVQQNLFEEDQHQVRKGLKKHTYNAMVRTDVPKGMIETKIEKTVQVQKTCTFCQNYLTYLSENNGQSYTDDTLNKLSRESIRYLKIIAESVTYFTLYLVQNNLTQIPNDIHVLNRVLNTIGIVITQDIFNSQLNPKNIQPKQKYVPKPKNLIDLLAPYYKGIQEHKKQNRKDIYSIHQLLRMVIYCPTVGQVSQQLTSYQIEVFERQTSILKNGQNEEKVKSLLKKEFDYIKEYEHERLQIAKNIINTKPIYKQLQFQEEKIAPQSSQPQNYNVNTSLPSSRLNNSSRHPFLDKTQNFMMASSNQSGRQHKKQNKSVLIDLANSVSHIYKPQNSNDQSLKDKKNSKIKFKKYSDKNEEAISNILKKNIIKNTTSTRIKPADSLNIPLFKSPMPESQPNELSESDFQKLLYSAYAKTQGFSKTDPMTAVPHTPTGNNTAPNFTSFLSSSVLKSTGKKNNGYSSSLTQFIGRKQQEEQMECIQKLQKETYNRQLLNGQFVKNELYEEIKLGIAKIFPTYAQSNGLADSLVCFKQINNLVSEDKQSIPQHPQSFKNLKPTKAKSNVIQQNSTKFNQSGLIRNQKYNKSIKNELINHRQSYLRNVQNQNLSKMHLAQTSKLKKNNSNNQHHKNIKQYYQEQLKRHLCRKDSGEQSSL